MSGMSLRPPRKTGPKVKPHLQRNNELLAKLIAGGKPFIVDSTTERKRMSVRGGGAGADIRTHRTDDGKGFWVKLRNVTYPAK